MTWWVFTPVGWRPPATFRVWRAGAWKVVSSVKVWDGAAWKVIHPIVPPAPPPSPPVPPAPPPPTEPLSVSCFPPQVSKRLVNSAAPVVTNTTTATPAGGVAPYSVVWEVMSWSDNTSVAPTINASAALTTAFTATDVPYNDPVTATFRVTARDAAGSIAVAQVDATFYRINTL